MKLKWKTCFKVAVSLFVLFLCMHYWSSAANLLSMVFSAAGPLFIGCIVAYLVNILMRFYEKHYFPRTQTGSLVKSRRPVCMIAAFITLIAVVVLVVWLIVPQLVSCVQLLLAEVPAAVRNIIAWGRSNGIIPENILDALGQINWRERINQIVDVLTTGIGSAAEILITSVSSVFSGVVTALLSAIFAIYILAGKEKLADQFLRLGNRYLKPAWMGKVRYVVDTMNDCFHKYVVGQCVEAVILGGLCTVGMLILRLPYALMIGAVIAFTALIPVAGAYIGGAIGAFIILMESPVKALIFLIFLVVLQQLEGNIIYPRVVGSSLGLPAIWVLAAVTVGGGVMGIPGMLLGVPLAATVYRLIRNDVNKAVIAEGSMHADASIEQKDSPGDHASDSADG